ncbi:MAG: ABC transporter ATP-binding protein, partial [Oscillospiraceae bacterium]|nr:ABC transporter ATP-binding protein [Oscillospiraceae bacterium]
DVYKRHLFDNPVHPYTRSLLSAIPIPDPRLERARVLTAFDPGGFDRSGELAEVSPGHLVLQGGGGV